jgi:hypothetical protein
VHAHILRHPYLESLGLVVDPVLSCLCCESCRIALVPKHVNAHIKKMHGLDSIDVNGVKLAEACKRLGALSDLPNMKGPNIKQQHAGLALYDGIGCTRCQYACLSRESMRKHFQQCHQDVKLQTIWPQALVQQLDKQTSNTFFRVEPWAKPEAMPDSIYLKNLEESLEAERTEGRREGETNARQISPWLLTTRWHEHIAGHDPIELKELVTVPKKHEFPGLHDAVKYLFKVALDMIDNCPELVLQRLNTPDPAKTYSLSLSLSYYTKTSILMYMCNTGE